LHWQSALEFRIFQRAPLFRYHFAEKVFQDLNAFGMASAVAVIFMEPMLPYALSFAAGAMIYVVVEELIPESQLEKHTDVATIGAMLGFAVMMTLDVALG